MPLDPSIPLSVRPAEIDSPMAAQAKALTLRNLSQQTEMNQALIGERQAQAGRIAQQTAAAQRAAEQQSGIDALMQHALEPTDDGGFTFNRQTFQNSLVQSGMGHKLPELSEQLDKMDAATAKVRVAHRDALADLGFSIDAAGNTPGALQAVSAYALKNRLATKDELDQYLGQVGDDPAAIASLSQQLMALSPEVLDRKSKLASASASAARATAETKKTEAEIAGTLPATPAQQFTQARETARDAETKRHNLATEATAREAKATAAKAGFDPNDVRMGAFSQTPYVSLGGFTGKAKDAARAQAQAAGLRTVEGKDADKLNGIQAVTKQLEDYQARVVPKLATSAGGRVTTGIGNTVANYLQTDPDIATFDQNWIDLVGVLKSAVGGGGVRINNAEINKLMTVNKPSLYDTQDVAKRKFGYLQNLLKGEEAAILNTRPGPTRPASGNAKADADPLGIR